MNLKNKDLREYALAKGVMLWEIAEKLQITDSTFSRRLRRELPKTEKDSIFLIVDEIYEEVRRND